MATIEEKTAAIAEAQAALDAANALMVETPVETTEVHVTEGEVISIVEDDAAPKA
jgi:hypothetical protein